MLGRRREARSLPVVVHPGAAAERLQDTPAVVVVAVCQLATLAGSEHSALANNPHHSARSSVDVDVLCLDENAQRNFDECKPVVDEPFLKPAVVPKWHVWPRPPERMQCALRSRH